MVMYLDRSACPSQHGKEKDLPEREQTKALHVSRLGVTSRAELELSRVSCYQVRSYEGAQSGVGEWSVRCFRKVDVGREAVVHMML